MIDAASSILGNRMQLQREEYVIRKYHRHLALEYGLGHSETGDRNIVNRKCI